MEKHLSPLEAKYSSSCSSSTRKIPLCRHRPIFIIRLRVYFTVYSMNAILPKVLIRTRMSGQDPSFAGNDSQQGGRASLWFARGLDLSLLALFYLLYKRALRADKRISFSVNIT